MKDSSYTLIYAAGLGAVCALLLAGAAQWTQPCREKNAAAEEMRHILYVLDVPVRAEGGTDELVEVFEKNVRVVDQDGLRMYYYVDPKSDDQPKAMAVAFSGPGLWGPIKGFLSLEKDMTTVRGVTFHEQEETPGLGGDIASDWFCRQFQGKRIEGLNNEPGIRLTRGEASKVNEVNAITGATMTSQKVEAMLNNVIRRILEERDKNVQ